MKGRPARHASRYLLLTICVFAISASMFVVLRRSHRTKTIVLPKIESYFMGMHGNSIFWTEDFLYILHDYSSDPPSSLFHYPQTHSFSRVDRNTGGVELLLSGLIADQMVVFGEGDTIYFYSVYDEYSSHHNTGCWLSRMYLDSGEIQEIDIDLHSKYYITDFGCIEGRIYCIGTKGIYCLDESMTLECVCSLFEVETDAIPNGKKKLDNIWYNNHYIVDDGCIYYQIYNELHKFNLETRTDSMVCDLPFYTGSDHYSRSYWNDWNLSMGNSYQYMVVDHSPIYYSPEEGRMVQFSTKDQTEIPCNIEGEYYVRQVSEDGLLVVKAFPSSEPPTGAESRIHELYYLSWDNEGLNTNDVALLRFIPMPVGSVMVGNGQYIIENEIKLYEGDENGEFQVMIHDLPG